MRCRTRTLELIFVAMAVGWVSGCGSSTPVKVDGTTLNGNWNIVGNGLFQAAPSLSLSVVEVGEQVYANGLAGITCSNVPGVGGGGSVALSGVLGTDGSFTLTQVSGSVLRSNGDAITVVVNGVLASSASSAWSGTYSMMTPAGSTGCLVNETGAFTAQAIGPLTGAYAGALTQGNTGATGGTASVNITQGAPTFYTHEGSNHYFLPLSGTITVTGIPCFTTGTAPPFTSGGVLGSEAINEVLGDQLFMLFTMNDGTQLQLSGLLKGADISSIQLNGLSPLPPTQCPAGYFGTLSKQ